MENKTNLASIPFVGPLVGLLRSRKFLVALVTLITDVVIGYAPELEGVRAELIAVFTFVGSLLVAAIAYEDGVAKANGK